MSHNALAIENLTLIAGGKTLLNGADLSAPQGQLTLLVGLSGCGKSLTIRMGMGLLDPNDGTIEASGNVRVFGQESRAGLQPTIGCVFQEFGLLDEWTTEENIRFGLDHRADVGELTADQRRTIVHDLLSEFGLAGDMPVFALSRGMRQRCAIARSLAFNPEILFYDEPTSGLDPSRSAQVAERIREANTKHGKTSIVVTHDLESFIPVADKIILLDAVRKEFRTITPESAREELNAQAQVDTDAKVPTAPRRSLVGSVATVLEGVGHGIETCGVAAWSLVQPWRNRRWSASYLLWYLKLVAIGSALPYLALAGFILGLVTTWFTFSFFPYKTYTEPILIDRVIGATGFALYRVMVPGLVAVLVAARNGAAIAADVGNRVWSGQFDAVRSFGVPPRAYFLKNIVWAQLAGMPLLIGVCFLFARLAGLLVFAAIRPEHSTWFWAREFDHLLLGEGALYIGTGPLLWKSLASAFGVAVIAWFQGTRPKRSGRDIATCVTRTIILATIFVLMVQMIAAFMEFEPT